MRTKTCVQCGLEEQAGEFVGAFCPKCAINDDELFRLTKTIRLVQCPRCERIRIANAWHEESNELLRDLAVSKLKSRHDIEDAKLVMAKKVRNVWTIELRVQLSVDGKSLDKRVTVPLQLEKKPCEECKKMASGYHEAILQLRGSADIVQQTAMKMQRIIEKESLVTKIETRREGMDLFVADKHTAMKLVMNIHRPYQATRKLKGIKQGKHHFITTICIRL
ncbi:60S ribosomal export protein NMD3 [Candidatus Micrarchaeota archaeon]|nr:60S ribosomal export protein NMD3 [Candidatus Micrarchaeota archaeon]